MELVIALILLILLPLTNSSVMQSKKSFFTKAFLQLQMKRTNGNSNATSVSQSIDSNFFNKQDEIDQYKSPKIRLFVIHEDYFAPFKRTKRDGIEIYTEDDEDSSEDKIVLKANDKFIGFYEKKVEPTTLTPKALWWEAVDYFTDYGSWYFALDNED